MVFGLSNFVLSIILIAVSLLLIIGGFIIKKLFKLFFIIGIIILIAVGWFWFF